MFEQRTRPDTLAVGKGGEAWKPLSFVLCRPKSDQLMSLLQISLMMRVSDEEIKWKHSKLRKQSVDKTK